jgi:hypothetical protein
MTPGYSLQAKLNSRPSTKIISSTRDSSTIRRTGGAIAATSSPWYRRVLRPGTVEDAYPPIELATSHSREISASRSFSPRGVDEVAWFTFPP